MHDLADKFDTDGCSEYDTEYYLHLPISTKY